MYFDVCVCEYDSKWDDQKKYCNWELGLEKKDDWSYSVTQSAILLLVHTK
jgi:hypothetical protein